MKTVRNIISLALLLPGKALAAACPDDTQFRNIINGQCISTYEEWIKSVWDWALIILIPLSVLILSAAGFLYMTSGGNPDRIKTAKKMIVGVLSGVGLIILARILLVNVIGVSSGWNI